MSRTHRRTTSVVGVAFGALLASPLIAFCTGSVASADAGDDLVGIGPFAIGAYNDTVTYDSSLPPESSCESCKTELRLLQVSDAHVNSA